MAQVIPQSQIASAYTTLIAARYDEFQKARATGYLRSQFKDNITKVRYPSYEVRRGSEKIAIDLVLGHQGNRNQITKATQKIADGFYFKEYIDATEMDAYWRMFGSSSVNVNVMTGFVDELMVYQKANQDKIDRAYEVFCAEVFEFGTCTSFRDNTVVDFKRKAGSLVDKGAGQYWADAGVNPYDDMAAGCDWMRQNGLATGAVFKATLGAQAFSDLMTNTIVLGRNDIKMWKLDDIVKPDMKIDGQTYHGTISCGPYIVHLFQYPQYYEHPTTGLKTAYMNSKKVVLTEMETEFQTIYAATPQLAYPGASTLSLVSGKNILSNQLDAVAKTHKFFVESLGLPVPLAVDTIYTLQVVAS